jgi:hypothetical protein
MLGDIPVQNLPGVNGEDGEHVQLFEADRDHIKEVDSPDFGGMVCQERAPSLRRSAIARPPELPNDAEDGVLRNAEAEFGQFVTNALCAPEPVLHGKTADERTSFGEDCGVSALSPAGEEPPDDSIDISLPAEDRIRLDDPQGLFPVLVELAVEDPKEPVPISELGSADGPFVDGQLMKQGHNEDLLLEND